MVIICSSDVVYINSGSLLNKYDISLNCDMCANMVFEACVFSVAVLMMNVN